MEQQLVGFVPWLRGQCHCMQDSVQVIHVEDVGCGSSSYPVDLGVGQKLFLPCLKCDALSQTSGLVMVWSSGTNHIFIPKWNVLVVNE